MKAFKHTVLTVAALGGVACSGDDGNTTTPPAPNKPATISVMSGDGQAAPLGNTLSAPMIAIVKDSAGKPLAGASVTWTVDDRSAVGGNTGVLATPATTVTDADGTTRATLRLGAARGPGFASATATGVHLSAGFQNFAYIPPLKVNVVNAADNPALTTCTGIRDSYLATVTDGATGDNSVSAGVTWLTAPGDVYDGLTFITVGLLYGHVTYGPATGPHLVRIAAGGITSAPASRMVASPCPPSQIALSVTGGNVVSPAVPVVVSAMLKNDSGLGVVGATVSWTTSGGTFSAPTSTSNADGIATNTLMVIGTPGSRLLQANTGTLQTQVALTNLIPPPALVATIAPPSSATTLGTVRVRDGLAFVGAANAGMLIYDVGNGIRGGSPVAPQFVSEIVNAADGIGFGPAAYTSWWFKNPVTGQNKYLFVAQKWSETFSTPTILGDVHIVDVSDLTHPSEVGFVHVPGGGVHDLWMDEANQALYVAYEGAGVVKIDASGTLSGDMSSRIAAQSMPAAGGKAEAWSVKAQGGALYVTDMSRGLLAFNLSALGNYDQALPANAFPSGGGMSDLWAPDAFGYTGTLNACGGGIRVWNLGAEPTIANSIPFPGTVCTVAAIAGSSDGKLMVAAAEQGTGSGIWVYDRTNKSTPKIIAYYQVADGVRSVDVATINGHTYLFAATDSPRKQVLVFDATGMVP